MPTRLLTILVGLVAFLAAPHAFAQKDTRAAAKEHYTSGKRLYEQGEFEKAIAEFRAADQLAPSGVNDFNIALAYEGLGKNSEAIRFYRSYLARVPEATNRGAVEATIARLEAAIADEEARKAEELRRQQEAEARKAPPPDTGDTGAGIVTEPPPPPARTVPAPTGDPELDRAAAVDVNAIRDQRHLEPVGGGAAAGATAGGPPPPQPAAPPAEPKKSKPVYKQWWFWGIVAVAAYVLISVAVADSDTDQAQPVRGALFDMPTPVPVSSGGATVLRF